jgi:hypothetical protein
LLQAVDATAIRKKTAQLTAVWITSVNLERCQRFSSWLLNRPRRILSVAMSDVTQMLQQIEAGDPSAAEQLLPLVYKELRKLAAARRAGNRLFRDRWRPREDRRRQGAG